MVKSDRKAVLCWYCGFETNTKTVLGDPPPSPCLKKGHYELGNCDF